MKREKMAKDYILGKVTFKGFVKVSEVNWKETNGEKQNQFIINKTRRKGFQ